MSQVEAFTHYLTQEEGLSPASAHKYGLDVLLLRRWLDERHQKAGGVGPLFEVGWGCAPRVPPHQALGEILHKVTGNISFPHLANPPPTEGFHRPGRDLPALRPTFEGVMALGSCGKYPRDAGNK